MSQELADKHWSYIESLLATHGTDAQSLQLIKFHYTTAFVHGFKHGVESCGK